MLFCELGNDTMPTLIATPMPATFLQSKQGASGLIGVGFECQIRRPRMGQSANPERTRKNPSKNETLAR